jgi:hypothetical protein
MFLSIVLYFGFAIIAAGALSIIYPLRFLKIRNRAAGALVAVSGLIVVAIALAIPSREKRIVTPVSLLDQSMPVWQFAEHHAIRVSAPPEQVYKAIRDLPANEIFLFRTLTAIRRFGRPGPENILNAPERQPLIDIATRTTFFILADKPPHEIVIGTVVLAPVESRTPDLLTPDVFHKKLKPGFALAAMNFRVIANGRNGSLVSTETRVFANSPAAVRHFAIYWRVIYPGSDLIRRMWLRAIKQRSEVGGAVSGR